MTESMIQIVHIGNVLLIGQYKGHISLGFELIQPRVLQIVPEKDGVSRVFFMNLIGLPDIVKIEAGVTLTYECEDENLIKAYRENVTGLTLASHMPPNVVPLGRG